MDMPIKDCITRIEGTKLDVLTAGMVAANPQELLSGEAFKNLIKRLSEQYDRIIIDTPPVLPVKDSFLVGQLTQGIILVVKANSTTRSVYRHTMTLFTKHKVVADGVILNQVQVPKKGKHSYTEYAAYSHATS